jgi:hypothetical protein
LKPGGFKLWVNWIQLVHSPRLDAAAGEDDAHVARRDAHLDVAVRVDPFERANFETRSL